MSRRALTLLLSGLLALGLAGGGFAFTVPYVEIMPGPAYDTLGTKGTAGNKPVIEIGGAKTYPTNGELDLLTVYVNNQLTLGDAVRGWFDTDVAVVPRELIYPPDQSDEAIKKQNVADMTKSQDAATQAAFGELGIASETVSVKAVSAGSPSQGKLLAGDVLTSVDGAKVLSAMHLRALIGSHQVGQALAIGFVRGAAEGTVSVTTIASGAASAGSPARPVIGIETAAAPVAKLPKVTINLMDVGGPSAGMMFALGIIDKLSPDSLTGGKHIAGTGEIDAVGKVGPIGGIVQKLIAARHNGATYFLSPAENCAEVVGRIPAGMTVARVATLRDAVAALADLRAGRTAPTCTS